ncbi:hypothetical protein V8E36_009972 [Tilletia maclaganii]
MPMTAIQSSVTTFASPLLSTSPRAISAPLQMTVTPLSSTSSSLTTKSGFNAQRVPIAQIYSSTSNQLQNFGRCRSRTPDGDEVRVQSADTSFHVDILPLHPPPPALKVNASSSSTPQVIDYGAYIRRARSIHASRLDGPPLPPLLPLRCASAPPAQPAHCYSIFTPPASTRSASVRALLSAQLMGRLDTADASVSTSPPTSASPSSAPTAPSIPSSDVSTSVSTSTSASVSTSAFTAPSSSSSEEQPTAMPNPAPRSARDRLPPGSYGAIVQGLHAGIQQHGDGQADSDTCIHAVSSSPLCSYLTPSPAASTCLAKAGSSAYLTAPVSSTNTSGCNLALERMRAACFEARASLLASAPPQPSSPSGSSLEVTFARVGAALATARSRLHATLVHFGPSSPSTSAVDHVSILDRTRVGVARAACKSLAQAAAALLACLTISTDDCSSFTLRLPATPTIPLRAPRSADVAA